MLPAAQAEKVMRIVACLERGAIIEQLRRCPARFPLDFTDEWLASRPIEELRHVFAAICIHCEIIPSVTTHSPGCAA